MVRDYYYRKLDGQSQQLYQQVLTACKSGEKNVMLTAVPTDQVISALHMEHPELYHSNLYACNATVNGGDVTVNLGSLVNPEIIKKVEERVRTVADTLRGSNEEIIRMAHNYLVRNVSYDYASAALNRYDHITHSIIGPFMHQRAVCEGIALAFKRLLDIKGIDSAVVLGNFKGDSGDISHIWNVVNINGQTYYIDVTQDIVTTKKEWNKPSYLFYMLTEEELLETHVPKEYFGCCGISDNPFEKSGKSFTDIKRLNNYLRQIPDTQRLIYFKCRNCKPMDIQAAVVTSLSHGNRYKRLSMLENAGRYYFYKEQ